MNTFGPCIFIWLSVLLFDMVTAVEHSNMCRSNVVIPSIKGVRVNSVYAFESIAVNTIHECTELCQRRKICKSANFMADERKCHLNAVIITNATGVSHASSEYIEKDSLDFVSIKIELTLKLEFVRGLSGKFVYIHCFRLIFNINK